MKKNVITIISVVAVIIVGISLFFLFQPHFQAVSHVFSSLETFRQFVEQFGIWAPLIYVGVQIIQVIVSVVPGNVVTLAGGAMFGAMSGFVLSSIGTLIGSIIAFFLARRYGRALVIKLIGQKTFDRYNTMVTGQFSISLLVLFLLPFFPNDILCFLLGLTTMMFPTYVFFLLLGRLPNALLVSLIGGGAITLTTWQWVAVGVMTTSFGLLLFLYGKKFEMWLLHHIAQK